MLQTWIQLPSATAKGWPVIGPLDYMLGFFPGNSRQTEAKIHTKEDRRYRITDRASPTWLRAL
jgi:hypothetical protein